MGNSASTPKVTAQDKAILDLKVQRDKLKQYQKKITYLTALETTTAREALAQKNRRAALLALRRKKYQETLLTRTDQQLEQLEKLAGDVEFALVQKDVIFGLQKGTEVLKAIRREMGGVEGVEKMMVRNEEERQYQEEIGDMLRGQLSTAEEDEVEDEMRALEEAESMPASTKAEELKVPRTEPRVHESLPDAPSTELSTESIASPARKQRAEVEEALPA